MRKSLLTACIVVAVLVAVGLSSNRVQWRLEVLALKAGGNLPVRSWPEVVTGLFRCGKLPCLGTLVRSPVTLLEFDTARPCPVLWKTPFGPMWGFFEDHHTLTHFLTASWFVDEFAPRVGPGDIVLEVGAWIGSFTRSALDRGVARVIAFEPHPLTRACFEQTFAEEIAAGRVTIVDKAAWDVPGPVRMANVGPNNEAGSLKGFGISDNGSVDAEAVTIDSVVEQLGLPRIDLINLDIEGNETRALLGARNTIQKFRPVIVACIHHQPEDREQVPRTLLDIDSGYEVETTEFQGYFRPVPLTAKSQ